MKPSEPSFLMTEQFDYKRSELLDYEGLEKQLMADAVNWATKNFTPEQVSNFMKNMEVVLKESASRDDGQWLRLSVLEQALKTWGHPLYSTGRGSWAITTTIH